MRSGRMLPFLLAAALFLGQAGLWLTAQETGGDLLLAVPREDAAPLSAPALEKAAGDRFLLTYALTSRDTARALLAEESVQVVGTNAVYRDLLGYPLTGGGFFTAAACEERLRHAVLNTAAAHRLWGTVDAAGLSFRMRGESWQVVGVLDDGERERARIYIPYTLAEGEVDALFALLGDSADEMAVRGVLEDLGIHGGTHDFWNLGGVRAAGGQRVSVSLCMAAAIGLLLLLERLARRLGEDVRRLRGRLAHSYLRELVRDRRCVPVLLRLAALPIGCGGILWCAVETVRRALVWCDTLKGFWKLDAAAYGAAVKALWLRDLWGWGLFFAVAALLLAGVPVILWRRSCGAGGRRGRAGACVARPAPTGK